MAGAGVFAVFDIQFTPWKNDSIKQNTGGMAMVRAAVVVGLRTQNIEKYIGTRYAAASNGIMPALVGKTTLDQVEGSLIDMEGITAAAGER
jgi:hypothetical protein